ncbi:TetR/AcrR family transcriptional regulator [Kineococcus aurantiacus]|uniref:TetR/AcrR family transcriptional regulator n=1 Tax=Kineococcus aurantiacus TaxID=37633 RepID=UPI0031D1BB8B
MPRAGLDLAVVTQAGAELVDEIGFTQLSMGQVAERLGVKTPSLYKHVTSQADLAHRIAVLGANELGDVVGAAVQGLAGSAALAAAAQALRGYVNDHPGRYAALNTARPTGPDDPFTAASERALGPLVAVLRGYDLPPAQQIHALRMLRSILHGYVTLEVSAGFQYSTDIDDSFTWMVDLIDYALHATATGSSTQHPAPRCAD